MPPTVVPPEPPDHPTPHVRDAALADRLTAGYARVLELEAERTALGRRIDALLAEGAADAEVFALVREQRTLGGRIAWLRAELAAGRQAR